MAVLIRRVAFALIAAASLATAQAASISGEVLLAGEAFADPGPDFAAATGIGFVSSLLSTGASGDLAADGIVFGSIGSINDFLFADTNVELLAIGSFSFTASSFSVVFQSSDFLGLIGTGMLSAPGFDDTPYDFSLSADGAGTRYAFSATLAPAVVPLPGALVLLISGLAALGLQHRR